MLTRHVSHDAHLVMFITGEGRDGVTAILAQELAGHSGRVAQAARQARDCAAAQKAAV